MDNASCHKNLEVKEVIDKNKKLLHSIPYQHYTNGIENFFSVLKSKLHKMEGLTLSDVKNNVKKAIEQIDRETYKNILIGAYRRDKNYIQKKKKTH